jgi:hypothetical protein
MTAKEKAEELFDKMAFEVCGTDAKICASIAVEEIMDLMDCLRYYIKYDETMNYWNNVLKELEQL